MHVLVVDDDPTVREILVGLLSMSGHTARAAGGGPEALALVQQERFDAIVLDHSMPEMTGVEVFEKLRTMDITIPVGFITGERAHLDVERLAREAVPVLFKPFDLDDFAAFVEHVQRRNVPS